MQSQMKRILTLSLLIISVVALKAQQDAQFTHYAFNTLAVNPGYAGSRDALTITGLHRSQWVGFDGAPTTQTLTLHAPILNDKLGLGLSVLNDNIGPSNTTSLYADVAYRLPITEKGTLAFGLKGGINIGKSDLDNLANGADAAFDENFSTGVLPNFGFGLYLSLIHI